MNFNNHQQQKEDPFSFLKGDDHDFNAGLKGLEDMYENMMEAGPSQKKKDQQYQQKKQLLQEAAQHPLQNPNVIIGVPVQDNYGYPPQYYQPYQQSQGPFNQELLAKQPQQNPVYYQQNNMYTQQYQQQQQPVPINQVQFPQQTNYNYPTQNQVKPNQPYQ